MVGMSPNPGGCSSLSSRLVCAKCWVEPKIVNPEKIAASNSSFQITVECHGELETKLIERKDLVFTQRFFEQNE